ncbi:cyclic lactone autoinducer peptide [Kineothrix sedimenti]|uniref:Cyclic lactone autoinducer peptide n=1 Tax=Kineothrix sedimenti TaxID=3123317 RepID=A0ABZ3EZ58_9FIRM
MKMKKNIVCKTLGIMNCLALMMVVQTANVCCTWIFHQPEFPEAANKFKKVQ